MSERIKLGRKSEDVAARWLTKKGFRIVARNFRCVFGEVDIIAFRKGVLYFVEVRSRKGNSGRLGDVVETIDRKKLLHIVRTGEKFVIEKSLDHFDRNILIIAVNWYNPIRAGIRAIVVDEF